MKKRKKWVYPVLFLLILLLISCNFIGQPTPFILWELRIPRFVMLGLVGVALALSGFLLQVITQNPLADPGVLGINQGAGFAIAVLYLFVPLTQGFQWQIPVVAIAGSLLAVVILILLSLSKTFSLKQLILNGIGLNAVGAGLITLCIARSHDPLKIEFMSKWLNGSLWSYDGAAIIFLLIVISLALVVLLVFRQKLDYFILEPTTQQLIGFPQQKYQLIFLELAVMLSASAVAFAGGISFIGLIAPHVARQLLKSKYSEHLFATSLIGMVMIWSADALIQYAFPELVVPLGSLLALIGAPYFLYLLIGKRAS